MSVDAVPSASRMPVLEVELPGEMVSTLEPSAVISEVTWPWAPSPSPTVRITAAMPIRMPSTVSARPQAMAAHTVDPGPERLEPAHRMLSM